MPLKRLGIGSAMSGLSGLSGAGVADYSSKVIGIAPNNLLAYWPLWESAGPTANDISGNSPFGERDGTEVGSPIWGQEGIGDGRTSVLFDGATNAINIFSSGAGGLQAAFNGGEGTMMLWARVANVGVWSDGALRWLFYLLVDGNNFVRIIKLNTAGDLQFAYRAGGGVQLSRHVATGSPTAFFNVAITWSRTVNEVIAYFNGVQQGATLTIVNDFVGNLSANNTMLAASNDTPSQEWEGYEAHAALWNKPLISAQIASLAVA